MEFVSLRQLYGIGIIIDRHAPGGNGTECVDGVTNPVHRGPSPNTQTKYEIANSKVFFFDGQLQAPLYDQALQHK